LAWTRGRRGGYTDRLLGQLPGAAALGLEELALLDGHRRPGSVADIVIGDDRIQLATVVLVALPVATVLGTATETVTEASEPTEEPTTQAPKPTKKAAPTIETTMEDGTYEIGVDAKPGRYKNL
jgi:hypothetical protein